MSNDIIQSDYERLEEVAGRFRQQADIQRAVQGDVKSHIDQLADGGWVGAAFDAFEREMEQELLPAHTRLIDALEEAARVTVQITAILEAAEDEAAGRFRSGDGTGGSAGRGPDNNNTFGPPDQIDSSGYDKPLPPWMDDNVIGNVVPGAMGLFDQAADSGGIINALRNGLNMSSLKEAFTATSKLGTVGNFLTLGGFGLSGIFGTQKRMAEGMNLENAMSESFGESTASTLGRIALYSNPYTGIPTLIHDVAGIFGAEDYIGKAAAPVGKAADWASTKIADAAFNTFHNPTTYMARNYPKTTIGDYQRAGKEMPHEIATNVYMGLVFSDRSAADTFKQNYHQSTGRSVGGPFGW